jgi:hypothetical protein
MVEARWSGSYPTLCYGKWTLIVNGKDVSMFIPEELKESSMYTYGTYQSWHFNDDWMEEFEDYDNGLDCEDWIEENKYWLDTITEDLKIQEEIFYAINEQDFRTGSCGGCI